MSWGHTSSEATAQSHSDGYSTSSGSRNLGAEMTQNVNETTQQKAHSVRGQRASVIMEVSEKETEKISTRVIANYNHMHALNIHYVIQCLRIRADHIAV